MDFIYEIVREAKQKGFLLNLLLEARRAKNEVKLYGAVGRQDWLVLFKGNDTKAN